MKATKTSVQTAQRSKPNGWECKRMKYDAVDVYLWIYERLQNSLSIAEQKQGDDRASWLEDAAYYRAALAMLRQLINSSAHIQQKQIWPE